MDKVTTFDVIMFFMSLAGGFLVLRRGFFGEISSKAGYLLGLLFALMLAKPLALFIDSKAQVQINSVLLSFLSYYVLFFAGSGLSRWIGSAMSSTFEQIGLGWVDKVLGFVLGCFEMIAALSLVIALLQQQSVVNLNGLFDSSLFCNHVVSHMKTLFHLGTDAVERMSR